MSYEKRYTKGNRDGSWVQVVRGDRDYDTALSFDEMYEERKEALEHEGMPTSDAQGVLDVQLQKEFGITFPFQN